MQRHLKGEVIVYKIEILMAFFDSMGDVQVFFPVIGYNSNISITVSYVFIAAS